MKTKDHGIIPALYASYDEDGHISTQKTKELTRYYINKGVKGLYVGGSSGECIYLSVSERKKMLEAVMEEAKGHLTIIAHVACNNTQDSQELAANAESLGVDAIAAIPPIYFKLPEHSIASYWNDISRAAPNTDFIIYNIPQLAGVSLTPSLLSEMLKNPRVIGVKNSSMPTQDIQTFKSIGGKDFVIFNGPDEQLISGLVIGAEGGVGGTYCVMPELYIQLMNHVKQGQLDKAIDIQNACNPIISKLVSTNANLYAVMKLVLKEREGLELGGVRRPLTNVDEETYSVVLEATNLINQAIKQYI